MLDADAITTLSVPGVLSARRGFLVAEDWVTDQPAVVVKARPDKLADVTAALPKELGGLPVDVRPATKLDLLAIDNPVQFTALAISRPELERPNFPDEVRFTGDGEPLAIGGRADLVEFAAKVVKNQLPYSGAKLPLDEVDEPVTLILHASPEQGWTQLSAFLANPGPNLVVGMYDFTSKHVLDAVKAGIGGAGTLTLTLDHPAPEKGGDQSDEDSVEQLGDLMGKRFVQAWALTAKDPKVSDWIYPYSYHIKVAVRDDNTFWLSSGNWNNSNQPAIDLTDDAAAKKIAKKSDRDWHVVATSPTLAAMFRAYLQHDYDVAKDHQKGADDLMAFAGVADLSALYAEVLPTPLPARGFQQFFPAKTIDRKIRIQPLLTPDNYQAHVLALVKSAKQRLYMQTQYIHAGAGKDDAKHNELIMAVQALIEAKVDVRLICSQWETTDQIEALTKLGLTTKGIMRLQNGVHNKGIVVDSQAVTVSSQNWSADGTLRNRDAGLIIYDAEAADYYEQIFLHDWDHLAVDKLADA